MRYSDSDLTQALKIISYLKSLRLYAFATLSASILYLLARMFIDLQGTELYLQASFTGIIVFGSLLYIVRQTFRTVFIYGISCILGGSLYVFTLVYYHGKSEIIFLAFGFIIGLLVIRLGVSLAFGSRSQEVFSKVIQDIVAYVNTLTQSVKESRPDEKNAIHCTYTDDKGTKRTLKIKLVDDIACFLTSEEAVPMFVDRNNVVITDLQENPDFLDVSISIENHDWIEAECKRDDFKKYQSWKNR